MKQEKDKQNKNKKNIETSLINLGRNKKFTQQAINPIIQRASSIIFNTYHEKNQSTTNKQNKLFYGRRGTLTHFSLQKAMTKLENGAGCILFPCGTSAITHSILAFVSTGDNILMTDNVYEPTRIFCQKILKKLQISTTWFDPLIGDQIDTLIKKNTKVIMLESPGSLTMEVQDIPNITKKIKQIKPNIIIILDNTWSAGIFFKALNTGVDISIQSGTKYLVGHSDAMIGTAVANNRCWKQLREHSYMMGQMVDPDTAYMTLRGLRTLYIRLKQHEKNALHIAHWLSSQPSVYKVNHPALPNCKGNKYFQRDFTGSSGLFSFILKEKLTTQQLNNYLNNFKYFHMAYSWGGYESLILTYQPEELIKIRNIKNIDFTGTLIRLHIGLENTDDLIEDLSNGFLRISQYQKDKKNHQNLI